MKVSSNIKNCTKSDALSDAVLDYHGLNIKDSYKQDTWRRPSYKTFSNWRKALCPGLSTTIHCEVIRASIKEKGGISITNDGVSYKQRHNETYAMIRQDPRTKRFTCI